MAKDRFDIKEKDGIGLITILLYAAMLMVGCNKDSVSISIAREIFEREIRPLLE